MTSSMLAGERRWASARRGGMTVLGKVAVPKPLNLPSQRLENHGLDPNVEIVPKGSLSWGSRSSSSASNPWGSSASSPKPDGVTGSPSPLSGRPSSGGSLTRPSTSGSDKSHEPSNAWAPNSRPSSASGASASNQASLTLSRPRSAETRPGSSQLSRFAESVSDNSVAWGPNGAVEKLVLSSKNEDFSLSSGDFPTLGSEKENAGKKSESQDPGVHRRPTSASGRVASSKDYPPTSQPDVKSGTVNTWIWDGPQHVEDGFHPNVEKWQGDPHQYLNPNVPPQHYDAWRGPPMNAPAGVWYRGPPGGPPYPPVAHSGYPIEHFPYYRPQMPHPAMTNSQPVPSPGTGVRGHHPKGGEFYRPQMSDAFIHPGMPIRPGFYPGPVPYDGYYGPPMGYPNERDIPFMGMPAGPPVYNMYSTPNSSEHGDNHARAGGQGSSVKVLVSEQADSSRSDESRGPYKVLMKQHNEWDADKERDNWETSTESNSLSLEKGDSARTSLHKNEREADNKRNEELHLRKKTTVENSSPRSFSSRGHSLESSILKSPEGMVTKPKTSDDSWGKRSESVESSVPETLIVHPAKQKDPTLIQKIEGLNAKVRASDVREDPASSSIREEAKNRLAVVNPNVKTSTKEIASTQTIGNPSHPLHEVGVSCGDTTFQSTADNAPQSARRTHHWVQGRVDHHSKGNQIQDADGWRGKSPSIASESSAAVSTEHISMAPAENSEAKKGGESSTSMLDPTDGQTQRALMKELAKQRAIQLQKEEEERIREQKAKALAKLEELNRRTLAAEAQKVEKVLPTVATRQDLEKSQPLPNPVASSSKHEDPNLAPNLQAVIQSSESCASGGGESSGQKELLVPHGQATPKLGIHNDAADASKVVPVNDGNLSRQKRVGQKQKQNSQLDRSLVEKPNLVGASSEGPKDHTDTTVNVVTSEVVRSEDLSIPNTTDILPEGNQRKKSNRSSKNRYKPDDESAMPTSASSQSAVSKENYAAKASTESAKPKASQLELDSSSASVTDAKVDVQPNLEQNPSLSIEETHGGKVISHWKPQHSRKMPRNPQANRPDRFHGSDAVVWAPVRSQNKAEPGDESSQRAAEDSLPVPVEARGVNQMQTSVKNKRAEMERYVPKPVAKELAEQGNIQQVSGKSSFEETSEREELGSQPTIPPSGNVGAPVESKNGDGKQNKQGKTHGAWRQRGQGFQQGSHLSSNSSKNTQKSRDQQEPSKSDMTFVPSEPKFHEHEWDPNDGWNMPEYPPPSVPNVTPVLKDQGGAVTGKGRRHMYKGERSMVNNHGDFDPKNVGGETNKSFTQPTAEINQAERPVSSKESRASQWQPKSQATSNYNQKGSHTSVGQNVNSEVKKDSPPHYRQNKDNNATPHLQPEEFASENKNVRDNSGHQDARREKRFVPFRGRPHSPNIGPGNMEDEAPMEQQYISSAYRKNGSHNSRSGRGNESRGDWGGGGGQDTRQQHHNVPPNRERQRQNSHYEYQPVGSNNNNSGSKFNNNDAPMDASRGAAPRYRDKSSGQHSRRGGGNIYGRQSGTIKVEASYD